MNDRPPRGPGASDPRHLGRRSFLLGAGAAGVGVALAGCGLFDDDGPERIAYGTEPAQFGELHLPGGSGPWPVVVAIHGGAWRVDEDLSILDPVCRDLRRRGRAVWSVEYRRVGEVGGGYPGTLADVGAAIDHLDTIAADHALDLDRVTLLGHSAGGTLALWAAGRSGLPADAPGAAPSVNAGSVISLAGIPDLAACANEQQIEGACPQFLGGQPSDRADRYAIASPIERLPLGLPQVIVQGRADQIVPLSQSERYAAAAEATGDPATLRLVDDANHFTLIEPDSAAWATVVDELDRLGS